MGVNTGRVRPSNKADASQLRAKTTRMYHIVFVQYYTVPQLNPKSKLPYSAADFSTKGGHEQFCNFDVRDERDGKVDGHTTSAITFFFFRICIPRACNYGQRGGHAVGVLCMTSEVYRFPLGLCVWVWLMGWSSLYASRPISTEARARFTLYSIACPQPGSHSNRRGLAQACVSCRKNRVSAQCGGSKSCLSVRTRPCVVRALCLGSS